MKTAKLIACGCSFLMASVISMGTMSAQKDSQKLVPVGFQKQLLVDNYVIETTENTTKELGKPTKHGVVMEPSLPHEVEYFKQPDGSVKPGPYYEHARRVSVVWNDQKEIFQMMYESARGGSGYAESKDGIHWEKPLISDDGKTNLICFNGHPTGSFFGTGFMIDPTLPWGHPEKYKAAFYNSKYSCECSLAYSADGIHWTGYNNDRPVTYRAADTHNQIIWDPIQQRYLLLTREDLGAEGGQDETRATRIMEHSAGNDIMNHPTAWKTLEIVEAADPTKAVTPYGARRYQMESMKIWIYENIYFNFMHFLTIGELTGAEGRVKIKDVHARPEGDCIDFYIGTSRTGTNFDQSWVLDRKPFIERGQAYDFDKALIEPPTEIITRGDLHYIYYTALYHPHHCPLDQVVENGKVGLATLPLDRFVCQSAGAEMGTVTTKPFVLKGNALQANVDALNGNFYVEVLDEAGKPIPGYEFQNAHRFNCMDQLRIEPYWTNHQDLSELQGQTIRLKFYLQNAKIYAFQVVNNY